MLLGVVLVGRALEERAKLRATADMAALQVDAAPGRGGENWDAWPHRHAGRLEHSESVWRLRPCAVAPGRASCAASPVDKTRPVHGTGLRTTPAFRAGVCAGPAASPGAPAAA